MRTTATMIAAALALAAGALAPDPAWADRGGRHFSGQGRGGHSFRPHFAPRHQWGGGHSFRPHRFGGHSHWRGGHWHHGHHGDHFGWWWVVGGLAYLYAAPVYPYPAPYERIVVVEDYPDVEVEPQAPPPSTRYWHYCDNPRGYYPYVRECPGGWRRVPAEPPR